MRDLSRYRTQTTRIGDKLSAARAQDPGLSVFGAGVHGYRIGPPLAPQKVAQFEQTHGISLPDPVVALLTQVGHSAGSEAAAGPFYGILPLHRMVGRFWSDTALRAPPTLHSAMSEATWQQHMRHLTDDDPTLSDAEADARFDTAMARLYGGLLILGHQGCSCYHALVVSGGEQGRVVNIDLEGAKPRFAPDATVLDWYERWLDTILAGGLRDHDPVWFGYED